MDLSGAGIFGCAETHDTHIRVPDSGGEPSLAAQTGGVQLSTEH
jgi:hypothetical protein